MRIEIVSAPETEPVSVAEAKTYCRIDSDLTDEDTLIGTLITAAREQIETQTSRALAPQTVRLVLDKFPKFSKLPLPRFPLISVSSVKYDDSDETEQTLAGSKYTVDADGMPGAIYALESWPAISDAPGSVRITYTCGYTAANGEGEAASELLPARAKQAILYLVNHWYENRDAVVVGSNATRLPMAVESLIAPMKTYYRAPA